MSAVVQYEQPILADHDLSEKRFGKFIIDTDGADPVASRGDLVIYDKEDTAPREGDFFITQSDKSGDLFLVGAQKIDGYWYAAQPNCKAMRKKIIGPMEEEFFRSKIRGRISAVFYFQPDAAVQP